MSDTHFQILKYSGLSVATILVDNPRSLFSFLLKRYDTQPAQFGAMSCDQRGEVKTFMRHKTYACYMAINFSTAHTPNSHLRNV